MVALMIGVLTFVALFVDMALDGFGRLSWDFFTSYPSRRPGRPGFLSAWVGSTLVMLPFRVLRRAARRRRRRIPRGIRPRTGSPT